MTAETPIQTRPRLSCGEFRETDGGRVFVCVSKPHPETPDQHYFSLDSEAIVSNGIPTNAKLESSLEIFFRDQVRRLGGTAIKLVPVHKGIPDRLVLMPGGRVYFVELKAETGTVSSAQRLWHEKLRALGHNVSVVKGRAEVLVWLADITDAAGPKFRKRGSSYDTE